MKIPAKISAMLLGFATLLGATVAHANVYVAPYPDEATKVMIGGYNGKFLLVQKRPSGQCSAFYVNTPTAANPVEVYGSTQNDIIVIADTETSHCGLPLSPVGAASKFIYLYGNDGNDLLGGYFVSGGAGADLLLASGSGASAEGNAGNDIVIGMPGATLLSGGANDDYFCNYSTGMVGVYGGRGVNKYWSSVAAYPTIQDATKLKTDEGACANTLFAIAMVLSKM